MKRATLFQIAREGWIVLIALLVLLLVVHAVFGWWAAAPVLVLLALALVFFHDAPRSVPAEPLAVIAPVDGVISHRRECYDPLLDREAVKLSIRVNCMGAYFLRSPVEGTHLELVGEAIESFDGTASWIRTDEGDDIVLTAGKGGMLGAPPCQGNYGERIGQGRCCGVRRLARQVDVYLPTHSRIEAELGDRVSAGTDVLAKLVHKAAHSCAARE